MNIFMRFTVWFCILLLLPVVCNASNDVGDDKYKEVVDLNVIEDLQEFLGIKLKPIYYSHDIEEVVRAIDSGLMDEINYLQVRLDSVLLVSHEIGMGGMYEYCNFPQLMVHVTGVKSIFSDMLLCGSECNEDEYHKMQFGLLFYANQLAMYILQCRDLSGFRE